jgi:hypothetical protein
MEIIDNAIAKSMMAKPPSNSIASSAEEYPHIDLEKAGNAFVALLRRFDDPRFSDRLCRSR